MIKKDLDQYFSGKAGVLAQGLMRISESFMKYRAAKRSGTETLVNTFWGFRNFGDLLTPYFLTKIGKVPINNPLRSKTELLMVGSILDGLSKDYNGKIFGSGALNQKKIGPLLKSEIIAVRGELTRKSLGLSEVFLGDPGLLMSSYFKISNPVKLYDVSIIIHYDDDCKIYFDSYCCLERSLKFNYINVFDTPESIALQVAASKLVISTSLHGLVFADAYRIPSVCVTQGNRSVEKYVDYFSAFGNNRYIVKLENDTTFDDLFRSQYSNFSEMHRKIFEMRKLFESII